MKRIATFIVAGLAFAGLAHAAGLPDLGGRSIVAVTENAYVPLNFADPKDGKGIGWEYDAFDEIAKRLNLKVEWKISAWDPMIEGVRQGLFDVGMDGITITDERKAQIDFSDAYMRSEQFMLVRADEKRFTDKAGFEATRTSSPGLKAAQPVSTRPSMTSSMAMRPTSASSCSTRFERPFRR